MWLLRAGMNYDQTPVVNAYRNVTLPDSNRFGLSIGAHVNADKKISFDFGWMHLFMQNSRVNVPLVVGAQTSTANGSYTAHVDIVALQMNWNFV